MRLDPTSLPTSYRTSKVVGSTVVNVADETVGTIDDTISALILFAVQSVGNLFGTGP